MYYYYDTIHVQYTTNTHIIHVSGPAPPNTQPIHHQYTTNTRIQEDQEVVLYTVVDGRGHVIHNIRCISTVLRMYYVRICVA